MHLVQLSKLDRCRNSTKKPSLSGRNMPLLKPSLLRYAVTNNVRPARQAAREALKAKTASDALPVIPTCPSPTCECADMPPDLDIDRSVNLNGTMAPYSEHLIVSSGQTDWTSKIEDERTTAPWGEFVADVKRALGPKGEFHNPYHNVVVSTSSFETSAERASSKDVTAVLFPSFQRIDHASLSNTDVPDFIKTFLLPQTLHPAYNQLSEEEKQGKRRDISNLTSDKWAGKTHPISSPTILICSHHSRDSRCGVLGPLLHAEFTQYINKRHTLRNRPSDQLTEGEQEASPRSFASHPRFRPDAIDTQESSHNPINVGMISHVGGHKFAGNVIVYVPPDYHCHPMERTSRGPRPNDEAEPRSLEKSSHDDEALASYTDALSPLAGKGIWYGRVEPKHVEGIVEQTIGHGKIIKELFRGGINQDGTGIRLPLY